MDELKNKFDETLREKLHLEQFEFREEYWNDAITLIRAQKAGVFWKWVSFSLSIVVMGLTIWLSASKSFDSVEYPQLADQQSSAQDAPVTSNSDAIINSNERAEQSTNESTANGEPQSIGGEHTNPSSSYNSSQNSHPNSSNTGNSGHSSGSHTQGSGPISSNPANTGSGSTPATNPNTGESGSVPSSGYSQSSGTTGGSPNLPPDIPVGSGTINSSQGGNDDSNNSESASATNTSQSDYQLNSNHIAWNRIKSKFNVVFAPLWVFELPYSVGRNDQNNSTTNNGPSFHLPNRSAWSWGLQLTSNIQQHKSNAQVESPFGDTQDTASVVMLTKYNIQPNLYNQLEFRLQKGYVGGKIGLGYGTMRESFSVSGSKQGYEYDTSIHLINTSFGPNDDYWLIEERVDSTPGGSYDPFAGRTFENSIRYVEIPVSVYFQHAVNTRWAIMIGAGGTWRQPVGGTVLRVNDTEDDLIPLDRSALQGVLNYQVYAQTNFRLMHNLDLSAKVNFIGPGGAFVNRNGHNYSSRNYGIGLTYWIKN